MRPIRDSISNVALVGMGVAAAGFAGFGAAVAPQALLGLLGIAAAAGLLFALTRLPIQVRFILLGVTIGAGDTLFQLIGGLSTFAIAAMIASCFGSLGTVRHLAFLGWLFGTIALTLGVVLTSLEANIPVSQWGILACLALAFFGIVKDSETERGVGALTILFTAGWTSAIGVYISFIIGHPIYGATENLLRNAGTSSGTMRAAGFQSAPNASAILLSASIVAVSIHYLLRPGMSSKLPVPVAAMSVLFLGGALILTGSRTSVIATAAAVLVALISELFRVSAARIALILTCGIVGFVALSRSGAFAGRSLNLLASEDGASVYRRSVQERLWSLMDISRTRGYGFEQGSQLAPNPLSGDINNIDNGWLFTAVAFGSIVALALAVLLAVGIIRGLRSSGGLALASVPWLVLVTSAENVWAVIGPGIASVLLVVYFGDYRSGPKRVTHPADRVRTRLAGTPA